VRAKEPILRELVRRLFETNAGNNVPTFSETVLKTAKTLVVSHEAIVRAVSQVNVPGLDPELVRLGTELQPYAYVGVPLVVRGRAIGLMAFGTSEQESRREYDEVNVALAEEFARRVSTAVENARLFRKADELNRLKDEFLATLSHELRTPLAAVLGWSRMLASGQLNASKSAEALAAIQRNAQAQAQIVDDLIDVARGMAGNVRLNLAPLNLVELAYRGVEAVAPTASGKAILVEVDAPRPVTVVGDEGRLQQIVWNLLSNAMKFTPSGGRVTIEVGVVDGAAQLRVTDTGIGISPAFLPFVFDKFRQADGSFTRQHGGLGLGLAIARHLAELHGGSIHARSDGEGRGATFVVRLPLPASSDDRPPQLARQ
jgi:signal transduction histidine kinase